MDGDDGMKSMTGWMDTVCSYEHISANMELSSLDEIWSLATVQVGSLCHEWTCSTVFHVAKAAPSDQTHREGQGFADLSSNIFRHTFFLGFIRWSVGMKGVQRRPHFGPVLIIGTELGDLPAGRSGLNLRFFVFRAENPLVLVLFGALRGPRNEEPENRMRIGTACDCTTLNSKLRWITFDVPPILNIEPTTPVFLKGSG